MSRVLLLALALACGLAWTQRPSSVGSQTVVNRDQREIRAMESQAQSLEKIARSLANIERKLK